MEWQLVPPQTTGLHRSNHAWTHVHPVPQQPQPHYGAPSTPWWPPALSAYLVVLPPVWPPGHSCPHGPPPGFSRSFPPHAAAHLQHLPPCRYRASGDGGYQPPAALFTHFTPAGPVQAPLSPALLHRLTGLCQFPTQSHQNKPVPLHLSTQGVLYTT